MVVAIILDVFVLNRKSFCGFARVLFQPHVLCHKSCHFAVYVHKDKELKLPFNFFLVFM